MLAGEGGLFRVGQQPVGVAIGRTIADHAHEIGLGLGGHRVLDELDGQVLVLRALHDGPVLAARHVAGAELHLEVEIVRLVGRCHPSVPGVGHRHLTRRQKGDRLGPVLPPVDMRLELVELLERPLHPARRRQHLHGLGGRHAVGHERDLEGLLGPVEQAALSRPPGHVPEIGPGLRALLDPVAVVGQAAGHEEIGHAALADPPHLAEEPRIEVLRPVHLLQQAFLAARRHVDGGGGDDVPDQIARLDLGADLGQLLVEGLLLDLDLVRIREWPVEHLPLRVGAGASRIPDGELGLGVGVGQSDSIQYGQGGGEGDPETRCLQHGILRANGRVKAKRSARATALWPPTQVTNGERLVELRGDVRRGPRRLR